ncbi:uncharacterized protein YutE (UPF0331/DUF86 family) [Salinibacter ruber]|jgi:uncharacterized protein YutE (UPF0331/DUF86 family)|uniref:type VII toxin-antitoxin system HepT family RNase toxin n=1 Tax=Salinibacter ruber TaxID=146919 RepID=UPI00216A05BD|nr:DUF86 domain-containing protein [Salinibacter ruber]MCS3699758.1 uncharacterized protein YutE (UPF0331/DUF86 family) [Salinibacter ruber]MCS3830011.1 uncharacterized protein YutE (UPF0331/DUF86 family) [Salinibacter ruber]MCS4142445.1 uncharacterized protein YutE (UPF0331/DUF86 family) [Salinibacter ruber]
MVDPNVIRRRLQKLGEHLDILRKTQQYSRSEFVDDPYLYGSAERFLQLSIEAINDVASHVAVDENLGAAERAQDLPHIFESEGLIGEELRDQWADMIGFRNVLVHDYIDIDRTIVHDAIQNRLGEIERLRSVFARYL